MRCRNSIRKEPAIVHHRRWRLLRRCKRFRNAHLWHLNMLGHQRWKLLHLLLFRHSVVAKATHSRRATRIHHEVRPPKLLAAIPTGEAARSPALMIVYGTRERPRASFFDPIDTIYSILIVEGRHCHGRRWNEDALSIGMMIHVHQVLVLI